METTQTTQTDMLVFKDKAGDYFVLSRALLEWGRVPAEAVAELEEQFPALRTLTSADQDVQGYHPMIIGAALGIGATLAGFGVGRAIANLPTAEQLAWLETWGKDD